MTIFAPRPTRWNSSSTACTAARQRRLSGILAEDVVLYSPLGDEPPPAATRSWKPYGGSARWQPTSPTRRSCRETHHAAYFRLQIEDTAPVNGMDYILVDTDGKIAEVTICWRPLPSGVELQRQLAGVLGMQPWELLTDTE